MNTVSIKTRIKAHRFFAGEQATDEPLELNHRRIFILPSHRGFNFIILIGLLLLIAFVYNNNLAYLLAFLLASVFFISILHCYKSLAGLVLQKGQSKTVFAGEAAGFEIHISNPSGAVRYQLNISLEQTETITIRPHSKISITLYSTTTKRGWHQAGKVTVASTYPLGLFRAWSPIRFNLNVLVYPKPAPATSPLPESASVASHQGASKKGTEDFYGLKEYQPGEPIRHIHWKAFAKGLGVFTKEYGGGDSADLWLNFDNTPGRDNEERLSLLCRWVLDAEQAGIRFGLILPGVKLSPDNGILHTRNCLEALALF